MPPTRQGYNSFEKRLRSFSNVDLRPQFAKLAAAGFHFNPVYNSVQCRFCSTHAYNFLSSKDAKIFHAKIAPYCMFLRRKFGDLWINNAVNNYQETFDEELFLCKICNVRRIFSVFQPCGHAMCCKACLFALDKCPNCSRSIRSHQPLYY